MDVLTGGLRQLIACSVMHWLPSPSPQVAKNHGSAPGGPAGTFRFVTDLTLQREISRSSPGNAKTRLTVPFSLTEGKGYREYLCLPDTVDPHGPKGGGR